MGTADFSSVELIVIGASAGGIDVLNAILPALKKSSNLKCAVVIHLPPEGPNLIPSLMEPRCTWKVSEAIPGEPLENNHIYISPNDYHLCIEPNFTISLSSEEQVNFSRPSIDLLFESAAYSGGAKTLGILLTGANDDGAIGLKKIKELGGKTIVQDPKNAQYPVMPASALKIMTPDFILSHNEIAKLLEEISLGRKLNDR